ncbi:hypothetical protein F898_03466 [Acinetobacter courvalinii]|nr:hypothetical protein F898_03466 [Acinetobacter courvalinii]
MVKAPIYRRFKLLSDQFEEVNGRSPTILLIGEATLMDLKYEIYANKSDYFMNNLLSDNDRKYHGLRIQLSDEPTCFELK